MAAIKEDHRRAALSGRERAMLDFAARLTQRPRSVREEHLERLRGEGFDDDGIHDIVQVTALFAYYNRLADGLGVTTEPEWAEPPPRPPGGREGLE